MLSLFSVATHLSLVIKANNIKPKPKPKCTNANLVLVNTNTLIVTVMYLENYDRMYIFFIVYELSSIC